MIRELLLIVFIVVCGIIASQAPQFVQEYEQRLGGALDESSRHLSGHEDLARQSGRTFDEYARHLIRNADEAVSNTGRYILKLRDRHGYLTASAAAIAAAPHITKPIAVLQNSDPEIFRATFENYKLSLTLDVTFGVIGICIGWFAHFFIFWFIRLVFAPRRPRYARR